MNRRRMLNLAQGGLLLPLLPVVAQSAENYQVRLISGLFDGSRWQAGIAVTLAAGWKTYWRMPGDAGIPPLFSWQGSANVADVQVLFPAPGRFADAYGETVGYRDQVVFPLHIRPAAAAAPVELRLELDFAVCKDVCIPAKAEAELTLGLGQSDPQAARRIAAALALVPLPGTPIRRAVLGGTEGKPHLDLSIAAAPEGLDIFVEGPDLLYFRKPERLDDRHYRIGIANLSDPAALRGKSLTFTLVAPGMRLEQKALVE